MTNCGRYGSIELRLSTTRNKKVNERPPLLIIYYAVLIECFSIDATMLGFAT